MSLRTNILGMRPVVLLLLLSFSVLLAVMDRAPIHLAGASEENRIERNFTAYFDGIVTHTSPGPYAYRFLVPDAIGAVSRLGPGLDPILIDLFLKTALLLLCQVLLLRYLSLFFSAREALLGVVLEVVYLAFCLSSVQGPTIIETIDLFNLAVFTAALASLVLERIGTLCLLAIMGTLNSETTLFLIPIAMLSFGVRGINALRVTAVAVSALVPFFLVRILVHPTVPAWFTTDQIGRNIPFLSGPQTLNAVAVLAHFVALLGPLLLLAAVKLPEQPRSLRLIAYVAPLFVLVHFLLDDLIESRMWMPLFPILIPLALRTLAPHAAPGVTGNDTPARPDL